MGKLSTALIVMVLPVVIATAEDTVDFNRQIRPILADKCFQCHGPDEETLKAKLRLDQRESATGDRAIVPGKSAESEVIARVLASDPDEVMPPAEGEKASHERGGGAAAKMDR